jgi:hypothetical protein
MGHALRILIALLLLGTVVAIAEDRKAVAITKPVNQLLGRWQVVSIGEKVVPYEFTPFWIIDDKHVTVNDRAGEQISQNPYTIDKSKEPPRLVMKVDGEKDRIGWYRFKDKDLQILLTINTGEPPKSWDDGSVMVLRSAPKE